MFVIITHNMYKKLGMQRNANFFFTMFKIVYQKGESLYKKCERCTKKRATHAKLVSFEFRLGSPRVNENHLRTAEIFRRGQLSHTPHSPLLVQEDADQQQQQERQTGQDYDGGHQIVF